MTKRLAADFFDSVGDFHRPSYDKKLRQVDSWVADLDVAMKYVKDKRVAVQAGGAYGVWPYALADRGFEWVYTFEPDHLNFACLVRNCNVWANVIAMRAALGAHTGTVQVMRDEFEADNAGAGYVSVDPPPAGVPLLRLDDLRLKHCDLLCLDVEGFEYWALLGARGTIVRCKPVVMVEAKELPQMRGFHVNAQTAIEWLEAGGYKVVERVHRDVVMVPA